MENIYLQNLTSISRSTAAHSTLYINDTSSCIFQKNKFINKVYGNSLIQKHKIIKKIIQKIKIFILYLHHIMDMKKNLVIFIQDQLKFQKKR